MTFLKISINFFVAYKDFYYLKKLQGLKRERFGSASKSLKNDNFIRTYLHILSRKFVGISTMHTSKSAANSRYQGLEFTAVPLTGIAL